MKKKKKQLKKEVKIDVEKEIESINTTIRLKKEIIAECKEHIKEYEVLLKKFLGKSGKRKKRV